MTCFWGLGGWGGNVPEPLATWDVSAAASEPVTDWRFSDAEPRLKELSSMMILRVERSCRGRRKIDSLPVVR